MCLKQAATVVPVSKPMISSFQVPNSRAVIGLCDWSNSQRGLQEPNSEDQQGLLTASPLTVFIQYRVSRRLAVDVLEAVESSLLLNLKSLVDVCMVVRDVLNSSQILTQTISR